MIGGFCADGLPYLCTVRNEERIIGTLLPTSGNKTSHRVSFTRGGLASSVAGKRNGGRMDAAKQSYSLL